MKDKSKIQWTDYTWNIAVGCTKVDEDCKYCYMYRQSLGSKRYDPREIRKTKTVFNLPMTIKEPSRIFTSSLTDFFHEAIDEYRNEAWDIIRKCPQHTFQILTKRPERIKKHLPEDFKENFKHCILGTSVGSQASIGRIRDLIDNCPNNTPLFLSLEPLHGLIDLLHDYSTHQFKYDIECIDWVIVGGESGNDNGIYKYRPCKLEWIEKIINDCKKNNVPVFVKQLGTHLSKVLGLSDRHGGNIEEWPEHLQIREMI